MTNSYGVKLDRNGYAPSIIQEYDDCCYLSYTSGIKLDRHEVFHGAYREKSKALGLWVLLDHDLHMELHHESADLDRRLKCDAQEKAMKYYGWSTDDFIKQFGKNYL